MSRLNEDIEIYYSHVNSLQNNIPLKSFDYGYGQESLGYHSISSVKQSTQNKQSTLIKPGRKSLFRRLASKLK